ncbi:DyP-type peroxidase [Ramaria rubella]|nr:DyP-type peroxidase [Ramaria rubella]
MRFFTALNVLFATLSSAQVALARPGNDFFSPKRKTSIFFHPQAQPPLPSKSQASQAATANSLNLTDVQGDILVGMKKQMELFFFFTITDGFSFQQALGSKIYNIITNTNQLLDVNTQPITAVNIAFSNRGLSALGIFEDLGDSDFRSGQFSDASNLGDPGTTNWVNAFTGSNIHGVFLLASDSWDHVNATLSQIQSDLDGSIQEVYSLQGAMRPGDQAGHEHFGFMDGISQPGVQGFTANPMPGQTVVDAGIILLGEDGDDVTRPDWAKDGSFLAFRQLDQLVPEFEKFLNDNPIQESNLTAAQGSALLGARMMGRWKSHRSNAIGHLFQGAPVDLAPLVDDPELAADPTRNNDFTYAHPGANLQSDQSQCPFSAHTRKTAPRADFNPTNVVNHIIRAGIPYGPEVTAQESQSSQTSVERGLAFVAYQSNIGNGFKFIQQNWANNPSFQFGKNEAPGFDPIVGANGGQSRTVAGLDPTDQSKSMTLVQDFVVSRGGEYFFSPSLSALKGRLSGSF